MMISERVKTRILSQDKDHPENVAVVNSVGEIADQVDDVGRLVANLYDLSTKNENLVMLGKKVGALRPEGVTDDEYRSLIHSQIIKNTSEITIMDIEEFLVSLISSTQAIVHDHGNMTFSVVAIGRLTSSERKLINQFSLIPTPAGVQFLGIAETGVTARLGKTNTRMGRVRMGGTS
jgi:hypothetical protein